jgi:hypothetical protein
MMPQEIERDPPVDLAGRFARRDLEICQVNLSHRNSV